MSSTPENRVQKQTPTRQQRVPQKSRLAKRVVKTMQNRAKSLKLSYPIKICHY